MVVLNKKDIQRKLCERRNSLCVIPQKKTKDLLERNDDREWGRVGAGGRARDGWCRGKGSVRLTRGSGQSWQGDGREPYKELE